MTSFVIIGYGRFGELFAKLLSPNHKVSIVENDAERQMLARSAGYEVVDLTDIGSFEVVVFAVPISLVEQTIKNAASYINSEQIVMDICSVKVHPANAMKQHLSNAKLIATHPMFGPDSASKGLQGLQVAICPLNTSEEETNKVVDLWQQIDVDTILTTPEQHDKDAVLSQSFTYSLAKVILGMKLDGVRLTTRSFNAITEVARLSANDSEQLFHDMLYYNPYFAEMKKELTASISRMNKQLEEIEEEQQVSGIFKSE